MTQNQLPNSLAEIATDITGKISHMAAAYAALYAEAVKLKQEIEELKKPKED